jgi:hypothetical protein
MFEHMNSDLRRERVTTIDELKAKNFTLVFYKKDVQWVGRSTICRVNELKVYDDLFSPVFLI